MTRLVNKVVLIAGYLCLAGAALTAHWSPATQYELSIYASTPVAVWVLLAGAYLGSLAVSITSKNWLRATALVLGTATTVLLTSLPLVRDYRFLGAGDSLTHLGWTKSIAAGTLSPVQLLYPAIHTIGGEVRAVTGGSFERGLLLTVTLFTLAFLVFVPLLVRRVTDGEWGVVVGAMSAWLLLPINHIAAHLMPFPTIQAIFFVPVVLFAMVLFLEQKQQRSRGLLAAGSTTPLLILLGAALVVVHPQQAANVVVLLAAVTVTQRAFRRLDPEHPIAEHRSALVPTVVLAVLLALWMPIHPRTRSALAGITDALLGFGTANSAATVTQRIGSLQAVGSGVLPVFLKIFFVPLVYVFLSAVVIAAVWLYHSDDRKVDNLVAYFSVAAVPLLVLLGVYFVGTSKMIFRQIGFGMVIATILGTVQLARLLTGLEQRSSGGLARSVAAVTFTCFLVLSVIVVFPSPYIVQATGHVTDQQFEGYQSTLEYRDPEVAVDGIRAGPDRYVHGVRGLSHPTDLNTEVSGGAIPNDAFANGTLPSAYEEDSYLVVTRADYRREANLYEGLRYPERGFERLPRERGVNRVMSNGVFDLYYVNATA